MNTFLPLVTLLGFWLLVLLVAIRPRIGGALAIVLFALIGCVEAEHGRSSGVFDAVLFAIGLGVMPILMQHWFGRTSRPSPKP